MEGISSLEFCPPGATAALPIRKTLPPWPFTILALLIGAAGWYYLFYSRAAHRLGAIEANAVNGRRVVLRRINGAAMILLAALLYFSTRAIDARQTPREFVAAWLGVFALLLIIVALALADIRLTLSLRATLRRGSRK